MNLVFPVTGVQSAVVAGNVTSAIYLPINVFNDISVSQFGVGFRSSVTVVQAGSGKLAQLYADTTGIIGAPNPLISAQNGRFSFYAMAGWYDVMVSGASVANYTYRIYIPAPMFNNAEGSIQVSTLELEPTDLQLSLTTPIVLVPGQSGSANYPYLLVVSYKFGTVPYANAGGLSLWFGGNTSSYGPIDTISLQGITDSFTQGRTEYVSGPFSSFAGQPIVLQPSVGDPLLNGDGTLTATVFYVTA